MNVEPRLGVVNLKKIPSKANLTLEILQFACFKIDKA
jgi:hypothetical protein